MATAQTWLPARLVRDALSLADVPEDRRRVNRCRDAAVRFVERVTRRPLTGRTARFVKRCPPSAAPVDLPPLRDVDAQAASTRAGLVSVGWWAGESTGGEAATDLVTAEGAVDVAAFERVVEDGEPWDAPAPYRVWPRRTGWPANARLLEVRVAMGLNPTLHEDVREACVHVCRIYYGGAGSLTAEERRGLELVLPGASQWLASFAG